MEFRRVLFRSPDDRPRRAGFSGERRERPTGDQRRRFQNHRTSVGGGWAAGKRRRLRRIASIGCAVTGARNRQEISGGCQDRKSVVSGKSVSVRVALGGRRIITKKN